MLHRAACLAPLLTSLPLALPAAVAADLFVRPFLAALAHALASLLDRPAAHLAAFIAEVGCPVSSLGRADIRCCFAF